MNTPLTPSPGDFLPPELAHMLGTATQVIDQHVIDHGNCADCGSAWSRVASSLAT